MGVYGNDGTNTLVVYFSLHGETLWASMGQLGSMGFNNNGPTPMYNDVLPRLRNYSLW